MKVAGVLVLANVTIKGPIFGGWKGGRMWCPFGVPSRYVWSANVLRGAPFVGSESTTSSAAKSDVAPTGFLVGFSVSINPPTHQASVETCAL